MKHYILIYQGDDVTQAKIIGWWICTHEQLKQAKLVEKALEERKVKKADCSLIEGICIYP